MNLRALTVIALLNLGLVSLGGGSAVGAAALGLLVPLLPIAAITGHAGLWSSGLTGAALLKLKAAASIAALLALRRGHINKNINFDYGWTGGHHGGHGWHRKRRAATESDARGDTAETEGLEPYDPSLDEVLQYDQLGCGMRLVCELSATPDDALLEDEKLILELFGRDDKAPNPSKASRGKMTYSYAAILGAYAKDPVSACSRVYSRCPYTAQDTMKSLREAHV